MGSVPSVTQVAVDAQHVFEMVRNGGVALIHLDVAYALVARTSMAVHRVYAAKGRDYAKPLGIVGGLAAHEALHVLDEHQRAMVRAVTVKHDLPLSVVAPYRTDHPYLTRLDPWVLKQCTHAGTLNLLLNAGALRTELAALCWTHGVAMAGTSANISLTGSAFEVAAIDAGILHACDVVIDYGVSRYCNPHGHSSTIIDFGAMRLLRRGVCCEAILGVLREEFGVMLTEGVNLSTFAGPCGI